MIERSDPYPYPGTPVLKNLRNIRDEKLLREFEAQATSRRLIEVFVQPVSGKFDVAHLQAVHRHVFQDVYDWAGEFRSVNISKDGVPFGAPSFLNYFLGKLFRQLDGGLAVTSGTRREFAERAGYFSEGSTQRTHSGKEMGGRNGSLCGSSR